VIVLSCAEFEKKKGKHDQLD